MSSATCRAFGFVCVLIYLCYFAECSSYDPALESIEIDRFIKSSYTTPSILPPSPSTNNYGYYVPKTFDVLSYGAKGDGVTDDTHAFLAAWQAACKVDSGTFQVPRESKFLVYPITFTGPCKPNLVFQIDGTILAPTSASPWKAKTLQWLNFKKLESFTIRGKGVIDGQGVVWWNNKKMPGSAPTALRFYGGNHVLVQDITLVNSPKCHLKFDACNSVKVTGITISSPEKSPNTDGIHLQNSRDVEIELSKIACGDDCVSIQTGCSGINIHNIQCGPSHGISIGGLGQSHTKACVSNITVRDSNIDSSTNGVRIKTWPGGLGSARDVSFKNIRVNNVRMPIVIDQFYCGSESSFSCSAGGSAVAISAVKFEEIRGTYTDMPLHIACSDVVPCKGLSFTGIELNPVSYAKGSPLCMNTYPISAATIPPLHCYMRAAHGSATYSDAGIASQC